MPAMGQGACPDPNWQKRVSRGLKKFLLNLYRQNGLADQQRMRPYVDNCVVHYDEEMNMRSMLAKSGVLLDVRDVDQPCREVLHVDRQIQAISPHPDCSEPTGVNAICGLQQSTHETEESLSWGLEGLNRSLSDMITSNSLLESPTNVAEFMGHMALAINKLSTLEALVSQADNLRNQTIHRLHQLLTTQEVARSVLAVAGHSHHFRALSSLWPSRP